MTTPQPVPQPARTRPIFWLAIPLILGVLVESSAHVIEALSPRLLDEPIRQRREILREQTERIALLLDTTRARREVLDPVLGWRYRAGYTSPTDNLNSWGLRARREYDRTPAPGTLRVAAFGDSFVYGDEVADEDAWSSRLEAASRDLEVLNYGVGGFGLDQAYLRWQHEHPGSNPHVVLIGFTPDDLRRAVNVYRRFVSSLEWPLTKPRFVLEPDRSIALLPNPLTDRDELERLMREPLRVRELGAHDAWYSRTIYENPLYDRIASLRVGHALWSRLNRRLLDPKRLLVGDVFNPRSEAFQLHAVLLREFAAGARKTGAVPAVLMLPDRPSVELVRRGGPPAYATLRDTLISRGVPVWDLGEAFGPSSEPLDALFAPGGHYSAAGNELVADWLLARIDSLRADPVVALGEVARR